MIIIKLNMLIFIIYIYIYIGLQPNTDQLIKVAAETSLREELAALES